MDIQKAASFGDLVKEFGIDPDARVSVKADRDVTLIRDYDEATEYICRHGIVKSAPFEVPAAYREIFQTPTDLLKKRWDDSWEDGTDDLRMTVLSELRMRGVNVQSGLHLPE